MQGCCCNHLRCCRHPAHYPSQDTHWYQLFKWAILYDGLPLLLEVDHHQLWVDQEARVSFVGGGGGGGGGRGGLFPSPRMATIHMLNIQYHVESSPIINRKRIFCSFLTHKLSLASRFVQEEAHSPPDPPLVLNFSSNRHICTMPCIHYYINTYTCS